MEFSNLNLNILEYHNFTFFISDSTNIDLTLFFSSFKNFDFYYNVILLVSILFWIVTCCKIVFLQSVFWIHKLIKQVLPVWIQKICSTCSYLVNMLHEYVTGVYLSTTWILFQISALTFLTFASTCNSNVQLFFSEYI